LLVSSAKLDSEFAAKQDGVISTPGFCFVENFSASQELRVAPNASGEQLNSNLKQLQLKKRKVFNVTGDNVTHQGALRGHSRPGQVFRVCLRRIVVANLHVGAGMANRVLGVTARIKLELPIARAADEARRRDERWTNSI